MPEPREDETQQEFLTRCMDDGESKDTFPDQERRAAFCFSQWREANNDMEVETNDCKPNGGCCDKCGPVLVNAEVTGKPTIATHEDKEVMVVPVVAIVEGVLNDYLVPSDEFGKFVNSWEGIPIPVGHPQVNGMHVSANLPDILANRNIGRFHNVEVVDNKLKGEIWVYVEEAKKKGFEEVVNKLNKGEKVEVSTAYWADTDSKAGNFNGREYNAIHRNLRPDHLAILPDEIGACSIEDGCGTFQNQAKGAVMALWDKLKEALGLGDEADAKAEDVMAIIEAEMPEEEPEAEAETKTEEPKAGEEDMEETKTNSLDAESVIAVNWAKEKYAKEKNALVGKLAANERCQFSKQELESMNVNMLDKLNDSFSADYSGRGFPVAHSAEEESPLEIQPVVMAKKEAK